MIAELISVLAAYANFSTAVLFMVVAYLTWKAFAIHNLPPGPWGLPILGYLPFMGSDPVEETFAKLSKKYGSVMSLYFGNTLIIVLNNYEMIKEAFVKQGDNFTARPEAFQIRVEKDDAGIIVSDGEPWKEQRRFILSTLRDHGMGKLSLEPRIMEEIHSFLEVLSAHKGQPVDIRDMLSLSSANIVATLEFGRRFEYDDERYKKMCQLQDEQLNITSNFMPQFFFPWLKYIPFIDRITGWVRVREIDKEIKAFLQSMIEEHKAEYHDDSRKDIIDAFFTERNAILEKTGDIGTFTDKELQGTLLGLFQGGTEATTSTMRWGLLYMMVHPEIQKRVQDEIDDVIGMERDPTFADRTKMPYTDAVLAEVQRIGTLGPVGVPHSNFEETELGGYRIPKRSLILGSIYSVHFDPKLWPHPEKFIPERFMGEGGKLVKMEYLIPFGIGKRSCAGESLARTQNFLYFVSLLQRFTFKPPEGTTPSLAYESIAVRRPKRYKLCAIQRAGYPT